MKYLFMILFVLACQKTTDTKSTNVSQIDFSRDEVIGALVALQSFIDYPEETKNHQKNLDITSELSFKLMLPLHAIYDEKANQVATEVSEWGDQEVLHMESSCMAKCQCEFYLDILERNPVLIDQGPKALKSFFEKKLMRTKEDNFRCLSNLPPVKNLINHLKLELKDYQADSIL